MTHAIIYDRASTISQKDNFSRVNAYEHGIKIAEQHGFTWEYVKEIGSGTTLSGRPQMVQILDRIEAGEVQALIVQELDRLARPEEPVIYSTIRNTFMQYGVIIYTHTSRVDLNNDDDDFVADISMSVAKKERRRMLKRAKRGRKARAESGKFLGQAGLGYTITGKGSNSDLAIDPEDAKLVQLIFNALEAEGGNYWGTAKRINAMGYTGDRGKQFTAKTIRLIASRKIYIGISESSVTDKITHRPDLQIISIDQFNRVQEMIKFRSPKGRNRAGAKGRHIFTGFVVCGNCGGPMVASNFQNRTVYQCYNLRNHGKDGCNQSKTYSEHLILPPVIDFVAKLIQEQLDIYTAMNAAAAQYGKSVTEEALETAITGELESVKAGKQRLVDAISSGALTVDEAAAKLAELREKEQRLIVELASITEKAAILEEWQAAIDTLTGGGVDRVADRLNELATINPIAFRRILSLVFEPNSIRVRTERIKGSLKWRGILEGYILTAAVREAQEDAISFVTELDI